jgi:hypothetical protein
MEQMSTLQQSVYEKEAEAERQRDVIKRKEDLIISKENEKQTLKQQIEINNANRENEIQVLRDTLMNQHGLMDRQQIHMNEL